MAGFIKRYAECIGLDGQVLADEYRRTDSNGNGKANMSHPVPVYATHDYLKHTKIDSGPPSYKLWPFYAIALFGLIALISWYSSHSKDNQVQPTESLKDSMSQMSPQQGQTTQAGRQPPTPPALAAALRTPRPRRIPPTPIRLPWPPMSTFG